jgi:hypothetical protein
MFPFANHWDRFQNKISSEIKPKKNSNKRILTRRIPMKKTMGILLTLALVLTAAIIHGCGKDDGNGVGGKVIITGSGN